MVCTQEKGRRSALGEVAGAAFGALPLKRRQALRSSLRKILPTLLLGSSSRNST